MKKLKCVRMGKVTKLYICTLYYTYNRFITQVVKLLVKSGSSVKPGEAVLEFSGGCSHPTIMKVNLVF